MPRLTIIVPLMDQVNAFETTLASVLRSADSQVDVLVVHSGDYADPHQILDEVPAVVVDTRRLSSLLGRVAVAASAATSPWVFWLAPGIELTEAALQESLALLKRRDLGLISPRIHDRSEDSPASLDSAVPCLASSVGVSKRFHPLYLEEILGEQWSDREAMAEPQVVGPTGWAGLCPRALLEQWALTPAVRLPDGYAELGLGIFVRQQGWEHAWMAEALVADPAVRGVVEAGFAACGRSSNLLLGLSPRETGQSAVGRAIRAGLGEVLRGFLSPPQFRVAWQRFLSLDLVRRAPRPGTPAVGDTGLPLPEASDAAIAERPALDRRSADLKRARSAA